MLRVAIVGCGAHARAQHAVPLSRYAKENPAAIALVASCDVVLERAERFCEEYGFARAYADLDAMLEDAAPDAVVSVVPPEAVAQVGMKLLDRGVPCLIEKPPGVSRDEAKALLDAAENSGTPHMVSMNRRFVPFLNHARAWATKQGEITAIRGVMERSGRVEPDFIVATGLHVVDAMRHLGGEIAHVAVDRRRVGGAEWFTLQLEYASGAWGSVDVFPTAGRNVERYELYGEGFSAHVTVPTGNDAQEGTIRCSLGGELVVHEAYDSSTPVDVATGADAETRAWLEALRTGGALHPTLVDVHGSLVICFACMEKTRHRS